MFRGIEPPALDGKRLRDVIAQIDAIDLASPAERHTLSQLFETMLREIRDVSGDSGDFYTPRPLVRFMVEMSDPQPGEIILDPACGTGGFLVEAMDRLQERGDTAGKPESLHNGLLGYELRSLPLLLAQLNLLMHGFEEPHIDAGNGLHVPGIDVDNSRRADVILTHPPFGGAADKAVLDNFPEDMRTADTTLLFLQLVMSALKPGEPGARPARAAMIVPNGTLFADGAGARIKADLLERYALHTIVRLPEGVFAPYTDIPTNLLFFDTSGPTRDVWFYQIPLPEGRRKYTKTRPMEYAEFDACRAWWNRREENANAWKLRGADLVETDESGQPISVNLDIKNPNSQESVKHRPPEELIADMVEKERWVMEIMEEIKVLVGPHR